MKNWLRRIVGNWAEPVPIGPLPVTVNHRMSPFFGLSIIAFACLWGGFPFTGLIETWPPPPDDPTTWFMLVFAVVGAVLVLHGLRMILWRRTRTLDRLFVTVEERGLLGTRRWQEPLTAYRGIVKRSHKVRHMTRYLVDLLHPNEKRTINLFTSADETDLQTKWAAYARWLKRPALEEGPEGLIARKAEELDEPLPEQIRQGKVEIDQDLLRQPPEGLTVAVEDDSIIVTRNGPTATLPGVLAVSIFPLILIGLGFFVEVVRQPAGQIVGGIGLALGALFITALIWDLISRQRLKLGPEALTVTTVGPWGETMSKSVPLSEVQGIRVGRVGSEPKPALHITGTHRKLIFGRVLPERSLSFLENLVLTALEKHHLAGVR